MLVRVFFRNVLVPLAIAAGLFLLLEGGCRVAGRIRTGTWPETRAETYTEVLRRIGAAFQRHPYLVVCGRPDASLEVEGHRLQLNARGQRATNVRDLQVPKPAGVFRIVCEGGSTTLDILASDDALTWPARLGALLSPRGVDVANAGFSGWTSLESLVSLETRDLDLEPDLVIVFSGVNDLQPAGHDPFLADYSRGHAEILPRITGVEAAGIGLVSRSLLLESLLDRLRPGRIGRTERYTPSWKWRGGTPKDDIPPEAVAVYERNLRSMIGVAAARGIRVFLVAAAVRVRRGRESADGEWLSAWTPGLSPKGYLAGLGRYNGVARKLGEEGIALFEDPFSGGAFGDDDYADPVHFSPVGSERFAQHLADLIARRFLASRGNAGVPATIKR